MQRPHPLFAALLLAGPLLAACSSGGLNNESAIGGTVLIESVSTDSYAWLPPASGVTPDAASVRIDSLDRSHWAEYPMSQPISGVQHYPTYATQPRFANTTRRQRGQFPTDLSSLDTATDRGREQQALEGLAMPLLVAADAVLFPIRAIMTPPWTVVTTPAGPISREPSPLPPGQAAGEPVVPLAVGQPVPGSRP